MGKFEAGTKIRLIKEPIYGYRDIGEVFIAANDYYGTRNAQSADGTYLQAFIGRDGKVTHCPSEYFEEVAPELKLEVGKFYKAVNGTKVGPMERGEQYEFGPWRFKFGNEYFNNRGYSCSGHLNLISEWSDEVTFKVGDKVRRVREDHAGMKANDVGTVVAISGSSMRLKEFGASDGYSHDPKYFELAPSSPVTTKTITRNSVVPGVYGRLEVVRQEGDELVIGLVKKFGAADSYININADQLQELHNNIGLIINAMRNPEVAE